jgi:TRAP-type uncharacterized transport system fused permease subunit
VPQIALAVATGTVGVIALASATMGYARSLLAWWQRALLGGAAVSLIFPGLVTDGLGLLVILLIFGLEGRDGRRADHEARGTGLRDVDVPAVAGSTSDVPGPVR